MTTEGPAGREENQAVRGAVWCEEKYKSFPLSLNYNSNITRCSKRFLINWLDIIHPTPSLRTWCCTESQAIFVCSQSVSLKESEIKKDPDLPELPCMTGSLIENKHSCWQPGLYVVLVPSQSGALSLVQRYPDTVLWLVEIMVLLRQLSHAIKTQKGTHHTRHRFFLCKPVHTVTLCESRISGA